MILALALALVVGYPALVIVAWRSGGAPRLWLCCALTLCLITGASLVAASPAAGNRVAREAVYLPTALQMLLLAGFAIGLPVVTVTVLVRIAAGRLSGGLLYGASVASALAAAIGGVVAATYLFPALP